MNIAISAAALENRNTVGIKKMAALDSLLFSIEFIIFYLIGSYKELRWIASDNPV